MLFSVYMENDNKSLHLFIGLKSSDIYAHAHLLMLQNDIPGNSSFLKFVVVFVLLN